MRNHNEPETSDISFRRLIGVSIAAKLVNDTAVQIVNPFLSIIALGLSTNVVVMGWLISLRSAMGLFSPFYGTAADRVGYRSVIRWGLLLAASGLILLGLSPGVGLAIPAMILVGLGVSSFVPTLQAYVSTRLPYSRRARGLGMVEYSWALTGIVGLSLAGQLIAATNWRVPMFVLAAGLIGMWVVFGFMPDEHARRRALSPAEQPRSTASWLVRTRDFFVLGENARSTYATIATGGLNYFAASQVMIMYGAWLADVYGLGAAALGTVALVFGLFDLCASVAVSMFTDRIGKRRSVILGTVVTLCGYLLLPYVAFTPVTAVLATALSRFGFEFAIVAYFPLLSEQTPSQRGKVMTLGSALLLSLATIAGFSAPWLYTFYGIHGMTLLSAAAAAGALVVVLFLVRDHG